MDSSPSDLVILPILLTFFGALVFGLSTDLGLKRGRLLNSRWAGLLLLLLALFAGFPDTWKMADSFDRTAIAGIGRRMVAAHYAAGIVPLIALLICLGFELSARRRLARAARGANPVT